MSDLVFTESTVEDAALEIFEALRYTILHGPTIAPGEMVVERGNYSDVVLVSGKKTFAETISANYTVSKTQLNAMAACTIRS